MAAQRILDVGLNVGTMAADGPNCLYIPPAPATLRWAFCCPEVTMPPPLADPVLYLTAVWVTALLLLIFGMWAIWRAVHTQRYVGTRANTQLPVRHRQADTLRGTRRIDPGSIARARAMIPPGGAVGSDPGCPSVPPPSP